MLRGRRGTLQREEPVPDIYHVGLVNLGNSCFYNTILQSLAVSKPLSDIIADPPVTSPALRSLSPASEHYNPDPEALLSPMPITQALITLLKNLDVSGDDSRGKKVFNPKALLRHLAAKHEEYAQATQQDAHEVLRHLIDGVMMEEVDLIKKVRAAAPKAPRRPSMHSRTRTARPNGLENGMTPVMEEPPAVEEASISEANSSVGGYETDSSGSESEGESSSSSSSSSSSEEDEPEELHDVDADGKLQTRMKPFIASVFDGKLASVVICDECKHVSATTEDFMDISLSLRDDAGNKIRKRDRIRKTLQSGFFSKKSGSDKSSNGSSSNAHPRHQPISLSETEGSASASEYETDEDAVDDHAPHGHDPHFAGGRSRHNSLDPSKLGGQRPGATWGNGGSRTRDHSPLGRALSVLSTTSGANSTASGSLASGATGLKKRRKKPKIPKPTAEQIAYIRRLLVEIPAAGPAPLPIRIARPPGSPALPSSSNSVSSATSSMSSLQLGPDQTSTDLYECFRQFTSVEVLEGDNLFACHNCWKHMNPDIVEKRRIARDNKKRERILRKVEKGATRKARKQAEADAMNEVTPSPSIAPDSPPAVETPLPSMHVDQTRVNRDRRPSTATISTLSSLNDVAAPSPATFSDVSLHSEPSLLSSTDDDQSGLADIEDGNATDTSLDSRGKLPLTTANVEALDDSVTPSASAAPSISISHSRVESVSQIAPSESAASLSTAFSTSSKPTPPKTARHILRRAHKRYLISAPDLPPVLVIHLKRFQQTNKSSLFGSSSFTNLKKRDDDLSFPPDLDLRPFLAPTEKPPRPAGAPPPRHHHRPSPSPMQSEYLVGEAKYSLYAVVVHFGTLVTGHYSAYVKSDRYGKGPGGTSERKWFFCSDEDVRACSLDEVLRSKAYILFYERVSKQPAVVSDSGVIAEEPAAVDEGKGKL